MCNQCTKSLGEQLQLKAQHARARYERQRQVVDAYIHAGLKVPASELDALRKAEGEWAGWVDAYREYAS